jgi:hypothetical protein
MHPVINLVCTRSIDGNHAVLQRWYADHVLLLLASPQLRGAQLHSCTRSLHDKPPDYICAYEFANRADFEQFETGKEKLQATELTNAAAGRSAVEIVQRVQYVRRLHRRFGDAPAIAPQGLWLQLHICQVQPEASTRWLADALQEARSVMPLQSAQLMAGIQETQLWQLHVGLGSCDVQHAFEVLRTLFQQPAQYGQAPDQWQVQWAAASTPVMQWLR